MALKYVTKGGVSPQGKPRVFFTCHPQDHGAFFEEICRELLDNCSCAVYCYDPAAPAPEEDERFLDLSQMQLLVIPVTGRFLFQPNTALDVDFPYAVAHHIPVLPLMQEPGLEIPFNQKCGQLQFLDKNITDETAIGYREKLKKFLDSVLVGDELAQQIRQAFDAYIFLSYRKKDRKYAQELMRLIHKNDFCRDIAIWYDEFLTPGENFNDAIREALEKSSLFALAVTPNLVNEENYVMTTEYPMAKAAGKPILAAQLVKTDSKALSRSYRDIPKSVDARNGRAMRHAILDRLRSIAITGNDADPQHNFFIGLAYLSGIDVEVDHARAVEMITGAAEAGLAEAMDKLVNMYTNGEGVACDPRKAIHWREKRVALAKKTAQETGLEADFDIYFEAAKALVDAWKDMGCLYEAHDVAMALGQDLAEHVEEEATPPNLRRASVATERLGDIAMSLSSYELARGWYACALDFSRRLLEMEPTPLAKRDVAITTGLVGDALKALENFSEALTLYEEALALRRELVAAQASPENRYGISLALMAKGQLCKQMRRFDEAKELLLQALEVRQQLQREKEDLLNSRRVMLVQDKLGDLCVATGEYTQARQWYALGLAASESWYAKLPNLRTLNDLCRCQLSMAWAAEYLKDYHESIDWYTKRLKTLEQIFELTKSMDDKRRLAVGELELGNTCFRGKRLREALDHQLQAYKYSREVYYGEVSANAAVTFAKSLRCLAETLELLNSGDVAERMGNDAITVAEDAMERAPEAAHIRREVYLSYHAQAERFRLRKENEKALVWYRKGLDHCRKLVEQEPNYQNRCDLATQLYYIGCLALDEPALVEGERLFGQLAQERPEDGNNEENLALIRKALTQARQILKKKNEE